MTGTTSAPEVLQKLTGAWSTDVMPTQTTLTHIDPTNVVGLLATLVLISSNIPHVTKNLELYNMARAGKGAMASLLVILAQNYIATATDTQELPHMTQVIWNATMELQDLEAGFNLYQAKLSTWVNALFMVVFGAIVVGHTGLFIWKKYFYFGICLLVGTGLECIGYGARVAAVGDYLNKMKFLCQIIALTLAPALVMAGVYYLLGQLVVLHGRKYSWLRPLNFSYIFILCDVVSIVIQAAGGGYSAIMLERINPITIGTNIMVGGIAFQVASMTLFVIFLCDFMNRIWFKAHPEVKFSVSNFFALLFQTRRGKAMATEYLQPHYNQKYREVWSRGLFGYYPLVILSCVFFIYVRCVYRLVELSEGWTGYLITHEQYVMTLDGLQVLIASVILLVFHPGFVMGANNSVSMADIRHERDLEGGYDDSRSISSFAGSNSGFLDEKRPEVNSYTRSVQLLSLLALPNVLMHDDEPKFRVEPIYVEAVPEVHAHLPESVRAERPNAISDPFSDHFAEDFVAVPYKATSTASLMAGFSMEPKKQKNHRASRHSKRALKASTDTTGLVNPYNRHLANVDEELATLGPFELQYPAEWAQQEWEHEDSTRHTAFDDMALEMSHDEFFFSFGTQKRQ